MCADHYPSFHFCQGIVQDRFCRLGRVKLSKFCRINLDSNRLYINGLDASFALRSVIMIIVVSLFLVWQRDRNIPIESWN